MLIAAMLLVSYIVRGVQPVTAIVVTIAVIPIVDRQGGSRDNRVGAET